MDTEVFKRYVAGGPLQQIAKAAVVSTELLRPNTNTKRSPKSESFRIRSVSASVVCRRQGRTITRKFDGDLRTLNDAPSVIVDLWWLRALKFAYRCILYLFGTKRAWVTFS